MLPPASECKDLDGKMACMSLSGYSKCARQTVDLDEILNSIKENLRLEQKQVMEMNYVTMHRLLSPIQVCPLPSSQRLWRGRIWKLSKQNSAALEVLNDHRPM